MSAPPAAALGCDVCGRVVRVWDPALQAWVTKVDGARRTPDFDRVIRKTSYNIPPMAPLPILMADKAEAASGRTGPDDGPGMRGDVARWGFPGPGRTVFNARSEAAAASPMWAPLLGHGHAVVPVSGFYEWDHGGRPGVEGRGSRQPYYVTRRDGTPLLLAGLAGVRVVEGEPRLAVSILTCPANAFMARWHERMPVVLPPEGESRWLRAGPAEALDLMRACPDDALQGHRVASAVNAVANDHAGLVKPYLGLDAY